jgi:hypothetical protein
MKRVGLLIICLSLLSAGVNAQREAEWTVMSYMALDNDLEREGFGDLREMSFAGSDSDVNILVQYDRTQGYDESDGDWTTTRRYLVEETEPELIDPRDIAEEIAPYFVTEELSEDAFIDTLVQLSEDNFEEYQTFLGRFGISVYEPFRQEALDDIGEADMGDPRTLEDFMGWAIENYPAEKYILIISDHGGGWLSIGPDSDDGNSMLTLPEIDEALANVRERYDIDKFDIVGFDACLMSQLEVAATLVDHADYMIAAQEVIPGQGWEYTNSLLALKDNPDMDAFELGNVIVDSYMEYYGGIGGRTKVDLALIELDKIPDLVDAVNNFAEVAQEDSETYLSAIGVARNNVQIFGADLGTRGEFFSSIDLRHFMQLLSLQTTISADVYDATQEVLAKFDDAVVYARADEKLPNSYGLAIYMPLYESDYTRVSDYIPYRNQIPRNLREWDNFLAGFYETSNRILNPRDLKIEIQQVFHVGREISVETQPTFLFVGEGLGVVDMRYFATRQNSRGQLELIDASSIAIYTILPSGEEVREYPNESTNLYFTWTPELPILTDGRNETPVVVFTDNTGSNTGVVEGVMSTPDGDLLANLLFDLSTRTLTGVLGFDSGDAEYQAPFEVSPQANWEFRPFYYYVNTNGNVQQELVDEAIDMGRDSLTYFYQPAESGQYEMSLVMTDLAGNRTVERAEFTVNNDSVSGDYKGFINTNYGISFPYPYEWADSAIVENEDGSLTDRLTSRVLDENNFIYVDYYEGETDADNLWDETRERFEDFNRSLEFGDAERVSGDQAEGYRVPYTYTAEDNEQREGIVFVLVSEVSGYGYVIDMDFKASDTELLEEIANQIYSKVNFFEPQLFD